MLNPRYYKITYFELIFLLNFLFNATISKLNNGNAPAEIIENFTSENFKYIINSPNTKNNINVNIDINDIPFIENIKNPNAEINLRIAKNDYTTSIEKIINVLDINYIIEILQKFNEIISEIRESKIIILLEKLNLFLYKILFNIEENIEQIITQCIERNATDVHIILNYYWDFTKFLFSKENIDDIKLFKNIKINDDYKYRHNNIEDNVIIIKLDSLDSIAKKYYESFNSQDSYAKTRFEYMEKFELCYNCKRIYLNDIKKCPDCGSTLKNLKSSFIMDKQLFDRIIKKPEKSFEILAYLKIREIVGNLIPNAFILHSILVPKNINGTEEIDILICIVEKNIGVKKGIVIECKMKEKLDNEDINQLSEHVNLINQINNDITVNGFIIYLGVTDNNNNAINVFDEEKIRKKIINFILQ